ncbi:MAG: hypothetical protein ACKO5K_06725 [Armatimonadota bacterium]
MRIPIGAVPALLLFGSGCRQTPPFPPSEMARLADPPAFASLPVERWVSAVPGTAWTLEAIGGPKSRIRVLCVGEANVLGRRGLRFRLDLNGKPWREEVLGTSSQGLILLEMGKAGGAGMRFEPPMVLASRLPRPGEEFPWSGAIRIGSERIAARGYAVTRDPEPVGTTGSPGRSLVLDSLVELLPEGSEPIPFPVSRWYGSEFGLSRVRLGIAGNMTTFEARERTAGNAR